MDRWTYVTIVVLSVLTAIALRVLGDQAWWVIPPVLFACAVAMTWRQWGIRSVLISAAVAVALGAFLKLV
jgi:hypothetical protein